MRHMCDSVIPWISQNDEGVMKGFKDTILTDKALQVKNSDNNQEMPDNPEPQWKANPHWKTTKEDGVRSDVWLFVKRLDNNQLMNREDNGEYTHIFLFLGRTYKGGPFIKNGGNGQKRRGGTSFQTTQAKRHLGGSHPNFISTLSREKSLYQRQMEL